MKDWYSYLDITEQKQLNDNKGFIIFDFSYYSKDMFDFCPYLFNFSIGTNECSDIKVNQRFANKCYWTISKKYGRKLSKVGYPYAVDLDRENIMMLSIKLGTKKNPFIMALNFPLKISLTTANPYSYLQFILNLDTGDFRFKTLKKSDISTGYDSIIWSNRKTDDNQHKTEHYHFMTAAQYIEETNTFNYENIITPF